MSGTRKGTAAAAALALAVAAVPVAAQELRYATFVPPASTTNTAGVVPTLQAITDATGGELSFRMFPGGQLLGGTEMLAGISDGIADVGFIAPVYFVTELAVNNIVSDMMAFGTDPIAVGGAMVETVMLDCPRCIEEYTSHNLVFLGGHVPTPYRLLCTREISTAADLEGMRMRGGGAAMGRTAVALGGVPVQMGAGEMYEAMERGQVDCVVGPTAWLRQYSLSEVVRSVLDEPLGVIAGLSTITFNLETWQNLSDEHRAAVLRNAPMIVADTTITGYVVVEEALDAELQAAGLTYLPPDDSIMAALTTHREMEMEAIARSAEARGVTNPHEIMDAYLRNLEKWEALSRDRIAGDLDTFRELLWEEVYSRVDF